jgi:hypothetical protein
MIYTYTFDTTPKFARRWTEPLVKHVFDRQTRQRFQRMHDFLAAHSLEVIEWQRLSRL